MRNDIKKESAEKLANKQHINDLQFRLDIVAIKAKTRGQKARIGSTMTYEVVTKRQRRIDKQNRLKQFGKFKSSVNGKSFTYLKDGEYLPR